MLTNFKDEDFDTKIKNEDVSVIQFSAEWCGPCKALKPVMDKLSDEYKDKAGFYYACLLYTSPSPRDRQKSRMPSSA